MFEMLTGKLPYKGDSAVEIALKHMKNEFPSAKEINPVIPQSVENIIIKAAAKNPKNRYRDARQMAEDIKTCLDEQRLNEEKITFRYPETDLTDSKKISIQTEENKTNVEPKIKQIKEEDVIDKKNKSKIKLIILISFIFSLSLLFILIIYPKISDKKEVKLPDVYGMEIDQAEEKLKKAGFKIKSISKTSDEVEKNLVIETNPTKNRYIKKGSKVNIYYSKGTKKITLENYVGKNVYEVKAKLELDGINVEIVEKDVDDQSKYLDKKQTIIDQSINANEKIGSGEKIILYIPKIIMLYPDMVSDLWNLDRAKEFCDKYKIKLKVTYMESNDKDENTVLAQNPKPNEEIFENDILKVVVSKKSETTTTTQTTTKSNGE